MAFAVLPYPSMDFVPLDVLTADELDQIVANINAVNNGSAGTTQIADSSITTAKVADGAITTNKVADSAITGAKIDMPSTRTTLWSGALNTTGGTTYNFSENARNFSYLLITFGSALNCKKTEVFAIDANLAQINATMMQSPSVYACATIAIKNAGAGFAYDSKHVAGWGDCYLYSIEGVK